MAVCRCSVRPPLKRSGFTSHEPNKEERRDAKIGISIFGLLKHFGIRVVPEYLIAYRQTGSSMSVQRRNDGDFLCRGDESSAREKLRFAVLDLSLVSRELLRAPRTEFLSLGLL